jgi:hypothetical protein
VFVIGRRVFVGSANVSKASANKLVEALMVTSSARVVRSARAFVREQCFDELGPHELKRLHRMYRPPRGFRTGATARPPSLRVARLVLEKPPDGSESIRSNAWKAARTRMDQRHRHRLDDFYWSGSCPFRVGDRVLQIVQEGPGQRMVSPPGKVVLMKRRRRGTRTWTFVYVEVPDKARKSLERLARRVGNRALRELQRKARLSVSLDRRISAAWQT